MYVPDCVHFLELVLGSPVDSLPTLGLVHQRPLSDRRRPDELALFGKGSPEVGRWERGLEWPS